MANDVWPPGLPQKFPLDFVDEVPVDERIQFQPDQGPPLITTIGIESAVLYEISNWKIRDYQRDLLETFVKTTLSGGVEWFDWTNPWPNAGTLTFGFHTKPRYRCIAGARLRPEASPSEAPYGQVQRLHATSFTLIRPVWFPA